MREAVGAVNPACALIASSPALAAPTLTLVDADKDGTIDLQEAQTAAWAVFDKICVDHDGALDAKREFSQSVVATPLPATIVQTKQVWPQCPVSPILCQLAAIGQLPAFSGSQSSARNWRQRNEAKDGDRPPPHGKRAGMQEARIEA